MLAPRQISEDFAVWNRRHGAPFGFRASASCRAALVRRFGLTEWVYRWDPFAFQSNSSTRKFEYPWTYQQLPAQRGRLLEIGGGVSGLQFVLSKQGNDVVNVDPSQSELRSAWQYSVDRFDHLNRVLGTNVRLQPTTIEAARFPDEHFDAAYCVSVLEHLGEAEVRAIMTEVWRCLKPGGRFVVTVDLFLNLQPFCNRVRNAYGGNLSIRELVESSRFVLDFGDRCWLNGYPEFSPEAVLARLEDFYMEPEYPVLTQAFVLRK